MMNKSIIKNQNGAIAIISLTAVSVFALLIMLTMNVLAADELKMSSASKDTEKTFYAAEAGLNEALYKLTVNPAPETYCLSFEGSRIDCATEEKIHITITVVPDSPYDRRIVSKAVDSTGKERTVEITATTGSYGGGLNYAVLAGQGGFIFGNNSKIWGDTYSNGNIDGGTGESPQGEVHGNLWVAGPTCQDPCVQTVHIFGDARARSFRRSEIDEGIYYGGPAYIDAYTLDHSGTAHANETDPENKEYPITIDDIKKMAGDIAASQVISDCDADGNYRITDDNPLPQTPAKILCNLVIDSNVPAVLSANLWVTGDVFFPHPNQILWLPEDFNGQSASIISGDPFSPTEKGKIAIDNNVSIYGSNHEESPDPDFKPKDFIFFFSISNSVTEPAINGRNNSKAAVYYAPLGLINVKNNGQLNNATAYKINLENLAEVKYVDTLSQFAITPSVETALLVEQWQEQY